MKKLISAVAMAMISSPAFAADTSLNGLQKRVVGQWISMSCEIRPAPNPEDPSKTPVPTYLKRDFTYGADNDFSANITVFADPACEIPLAAYDFAGEIVWHDASPIAAGAFNQDYVLNKKLELTVQAPPMADQLNLLPDGACGTGDFVVGETRDILGQPCMLLRFVEGSEYVIDHDVLYVREDAPNMLFMGGKHVDGTGFYYPENRPNVGFQQPLVKVN